MTTDITGMKAKEMLNHYQEALYEEARQAKREGRLVCWSASVAPPEFCVTMDIAMIYPENHAAALAARRGSLAMIEVAERKGYAVDTCSYARTNLGYMELLKEQAMTGEVPEILKDSPAAEIPLPDLVITCNNICNTLLKWYENLAKELNIPCIVIDVPFNHTMPMPQYAKDYVVGQFNHAITQLEEICGRPFDHDKFLKVQEQTQRTVEQWARVAALTSHKPAPLSAFDLFNYMALIVCARSRECAEVTFRKYAEEMEENIKNEVYSFKGAEKTRVTWEGIAVWAHLSHTFKSLKNQGTIATGSAYPDMWNLSYTPGDLDTMAEAYSTVYINTCLNNKVNALLSIVDNAKSDGIVYHQNRSCKLMSLLNVETANLIHEANGLPYTSFDGDQTDPRNFAPAQYDTRVQALAETMEANL